MGLPCAFGWSIVGLNIGTLLSIWIDLVLRRVVKNICIYGNPDNIHRRSNRESHPIARNGSPERDGNTTLRLVRSIKRNALIFLAISMPRYAVGSVPG